MARAGITTVIWVLWWASAAFAQAPAASDFVGSNACRTCHADVFLNFYKNPHFKSLASGKEPPERTGCESCHGPGKAHVEARGGKTTIPNAFSLMAPKAVLEKCLDCHGKDLNRVNIRRSEHTQHDVACSSCHSIHRAATPKFLLAKQQREVCYTCHATVRAQFQMPFKHRVNEGFMECSDCHNPHGSFAPTWRMGDRPRMVDQAGANETACVKCHSDKRGPFVYEHAPVRVEGTTCSIRNSRSARRATCGSTAPTRTRISKGDPMLTRICFALTLAGAAAAQQTVAPTDAAVGSPRGDNHGTYNVQQSFELGYRWRLLGGDEGMYRSVANYGNGLRLLGSRLSINSREGHGRFFDEILLTTMGLGNDPYQSAVLRVQKNALYRYDMGWRSQNYYNPGLTVAGNNGALGGLGVTLASQPGLLASGGLHARDTSRRMQDHDLTLLPQSRFRLRVGYSRNLEDGPALTTAQEFNPNGPGFPVFADIRREWNEYRLGGEAELAGFRLTVTRRWGFFKEDTPSSLIAVAGSPAPNDLTRLNQFQRSEAVHGDNHGWIGNLTTRRRWWAVNARATYLSGARSFAQSEAAFGTSQFGGAASRQILVFGNARRPSTAGDFALSIFPTDKLTVVNNTSILSNRIEGNSSYSEVETGNDFGQTLNFRFIGIRTVTNSTDLNYRATRQLGLYAAYRFSDREIRYTQA
ncbi:MAG: hypothetical protein K0S78_3656, partial [Thermomicrobiales bacterium]|nr:hypothetical protein [Thermomicrobiales bacterium]